MVLGLGGFGFRALVFKAVGFGVLGLRDIGLRVLGFLAGVLHDRCSIGTQTQNCIDNLCSKCLPPSPLTWLNCASSIVLAGYRKVYSSTFYHDMCTKCWVFVSLASERSLMPRVANHWS